MPARSYPLAILAIVAAALPVAALGCGSREGDPPKSNITPNPLGSGSRIRQVADPTLEGHPANGASIDITGATYLWTDTFDETGDGKSKGTLYFQDVGSTAPYSGASAFSPTFEPANLKPSPGDVLDLQGTWQENDHIGSAIFPPPAVLPQIYKPTVAQRFEYVVPPAAMIDVNDLSDFVKGRQWLSMIVTLNDVSFTDSLTDDGHGRNTIHVAGTTAANTVTVSNELFDLAAWNNANGAPLGPNKKVKSVTGIVTWFFSFHIAPRTPADIVVQ